MIFTFDAEASKPTIKLKGELFKYLIKVRRHEAGDTIMFRNPANPSMLYSYKVDSIDGRDALLRLESAKEAVVAPKKSLHIGWCVIDPKSVEKVFPSLNEIGVEKISFIYCDRSQKSFKPDFARLERILESSMGQCGRSVKMELGMYKNLKEFVQAFPEVKVFDFTDKVLDTGADFTTVLVGCEGGFSKAEKELLASKEVFRLDTPMVLRSESAVMAVASKILL